MYPVRHGAYGESGQLIGDSRAPALSRGDGGGVATGGFGLAVSGGHQEAHRDEG